MFEYDSILGLYSNQDFLNNKIKEKFNNRYVDVKLFTDFSNTDFSKFSYLIINLLDTDFKRREILETISKVTCKVIVMFPHRFLKKHFNEAESFLKDLILSNYNLGIILVPEIVGHSVRYQKKYISHDLIMQSLVSERVKIGNIPIKINLISVSKLVDELVKQTFSFGISGKKVLPVGASLSVELFAKKYLNIKQENILQHQDTNNFQEILPDIRKNLSFSISRAINNMKETIIADNLKKPALQAPNFYHQTRRFRLLKFVILAGVVLFITPFVLILFSIGSLYVSRIVFVKNQKLAASLVNLSVSTSKLSSKINMDVPFYVDVGSIVYKSSIIADHIVQLVEPGKGLLNSLFGDSNYQFERYANDISAGLDRIYIELGFIQSDVDKLPGVWGGQIRSLLDTRYIQLNSTKEEIYNLKKVTSRLSDILGSKSSKKYLILLQNNMELRPTGGFIGSFALITFEKGRITEIVVNDVYSADGQLKGHVDPPDPIKKYLNEASWFMRDANWDPDFVESAKRIEWFLDKEIDQQIDGVISIDLLFVKSLLKITGPINLFDFNKIITADNLYQTVQDEVETEFFPGSIKKASFLTSLSRNLITELKNINNENYIFFFIELYKNLKERHVQIYLHDLNAQDSISKMGYSGQFNIDLNCDLRCISDKYMVVDANLGVNKSNIFINRYQDLNLTVNKSNLNHELFVTYENNANPSLGKFGIYKNYARIILPKEAKVAGVRLYNINGTYQNLEYDLIDVGKKRELGFYFEQMPGTSSRIQIVWSIKTLLLSDGGEYRLLIQKQSGTDRDPLSVRVVSEDLTLTGKTTAVYNTNLAKDFSIKLFFRPK